MQVPQERVGVLEAVEPVIAAIEDERRG